MGLLALNFGGSSCFWLEFDTKDLMWVTTKWVHVGKDDEVSIQQKRGISGHIAIIPKPEGHFRGDSLTKHTKLPFGATWAEVAIICQVFPSMSHSVLCYKLTSFHR